MKKKHGLHRNISIHLNLLAVENAHNKINEKEDKARFYCVGNTPIRYQLNGYDINNLEGHKASKISVELIAFYIFAGRGS